jgi:hypothetical protein
MDPLVLLSRVLRTVRVKTRAGSPSAAVCVSFHRQVGVAKQVWSTCESCQSLCRSVTPRRVGQLGPAVYLEVLVWHMVLERRC